MIPKSGGSPEEGSGYPQQYSGRENSMHRGRSPGGHKQLDKAEQLTQRTFQRAAETSTGYSGQHPQMLS